MKTLNQRLAAACNILFENGVFLCMYNKDVYCKCPDEQLQFVTNHLSFDEVKVLVSVCELYSLDFGMNYVPSSSNQNVCVIIKDRNND